MWLTEDEVAFPPVSTATEDGLLAVGGRMDVDWVLHAYANGIFPWGTYENHYLWWSPDPRYVLYPDALKVSKSMRPYFNQRKFSVTYDQAFQEVITACGQAQRHGQSGTWIDEDILNTFLELHHLGYAHSVEVWQGAALVGGLYGLSIGQSFFGESMYAQVSNASKFGFITLVRDLHAAGFTMIDCQIGTKHLISLGAEPIPRKKFLTLLSQSNCAPTLLGNWQQLLFGRYTGT